MEKKSTVAATTANVGHAGVRDNSTLASGGTLQIRHRRKKAVATAADMVQPVEEPEEGRRLHGLQ